MTKKKTIKVEWKMINIHKPFAKKVRVYAQQHDMKYFEVIEEALKQYFKQKGVDG